MKPYLLRFHRWISLTFALPLLVVIATGLVLSVEPIVQVEAIRPGSLTLATVESLIAKADPAGKASGLSIAPYEGTLTVGGGPGGPGSTVDLATGEPVAAGAWTTLFNQSRRIHERLIGDLGWLVTASTIAMLVVIALGVLMGLPRLRNSLSGWHKGTAWFLLPLVILSPLTGLALAFGITFSAPLAAPGAAVPLAQAVRMVAAEHDLAAVNSIRRRGPVMMARIWEDGRLAGYSVSDKGVVPMASNWPRLIHEGNFSGLWGGLVNVVTSLALLLLLVTGVLIWARRALRPRRRQRPARAV